MRRALRKSGSLTAVSMAALLAGNPAFAVDGSNMLLNVGPGDLISNDINALNVSQYASEGQTVLNMATGADAANVDQNGVNILNMVDVQGTSVASVIQMGDAVQTAANTLSGGEVINASQTASNYANIVQAADVGQVEQVFVEGSRQIAENIVNYAGDVDGLTQTATNMLNVVEVEGVAQVVDQRFFQGVDNTATQVARNELWPSDVPGDVRNVSQSVINVANTVTATEVGMIDRSALGDQLAENIIKFGDTLDNVTQFAMNAANVATVESFGTINQAAEGNQQIRNEIVSTNPNQAGNVANLTQYGINIANVTYLTAGENGAGTQIDQSNNLTQTVVNKINTKGDQVNVIQDSHNIANEVRVQD